MTSFIDTRSKRNGPSTSREAGKNAASGKAADMRRKIQKVLIAFHEWHRMGLTAREIADVLCVDYYDVQRRLSETANIRKSGEVRDGAMVWIWSPAA